MACNWMARAIGGDVVTVDTAEFGYTTAEIVNHPLFVGVTSPGAVLGQPSWMPFSELPTGFRAIAKTSNCSNAAIANDEKRLYGVQFHPEVKHTNHGRPYRQFSDQNLWLCV